MADSQYVGTCLYSADNYVVLTETPEHEAALREAGWQDSPAAFGIETAPARVASAVALPSLLPGTPAPAAPSAATTLLERQVEAVQALVQHQDTALTALHQDLSVLKDHLASVLATVGDRVQALEAAMTEPKLMPKPAADEPKASSSHVSREPRGSKE